MKLSQNEILFQIRQILSLVAPDARVWLYGSRARGEAREDSDWDILILMDKERVSNDDFDQVAFPLIDFGWTVGEIISPKIYTQTEWSKRYFTPFYKNVEQDGIRLQ